MKIKLLILGILSALMCLCFVGCQGRVDTKSELNQYLHSNGYKSCSIEEGPVETGHGDFYWNVYDKTNEIHFTVYQELTEDLYGSVEVFDNYNAKLVEKHIDDFPDHEGIEIDTESSWRGYPILRFEYTNIEDLEKKFEVVEECAEYIDKLKKDMEIAVVGKYNSPRVEFFKENSIEDFYDYINNGYVCTYLDIKSGEALKTIKRELFDWGYEYHIPEVENEMTEDDIRYFWSIPYHHRIAVYRSGSPEDSNNKDYDIYEDIYINSDINFGNLYYLLVKEGFDVEGTVEDFTITNLEGKNCQFSYAFAEGGETYYLVDGEKVFCDTNYYGLYKGTIYNLFGLTVEPVVDDSNTNK